MEQSFKYTIILLLLVVSVCHYGHCVYLKAGSNTYARYSLWNACINASMSFDFKSKQDENSVLMYMDDMGVSDFIQIRLARNELDLMIKVSHDPDIGKSIRARGNFIDNQWHTVTITRNRMEVILTIDGVSYKAFLEGRDFNLGSVSRNSYLYFGGIPKEYCDELQKLSNPGICAAGNFQGFVRNVIYRNCTCAPVRADFLGGYGAEESFQKCDMPKNKCDEGCVCIDTDIDTGCNCNYKEECDKSTRGDMVYYLPMDAYKNGILETASGLYVTVSGQPKFVRGVLNRALVLHGDQWLRVAGPAHRQECFGDLDLCPKGYTISFWIKFLYASYKKQVYLTNGGHRSDSHGIAMSYYKGVLEFVFRDKSGNEWRASDKNVLPGQWYYIAASWSRKNGLDLVKNGHLSKRTRSPKTGQPATKAGMKYSEFMIGTTNDDTHNPNQGTIIIDEFKFWDRFMTVHELKQLGPIYHYHLDMDNKRGKSLDVPHMDAHIFGNVWLSSDAVIGKSLHLSGPGQYVALQHQGHSCLGNLARCLYGFMVSMWIKFVELNGKRYYLSTGVKGLSLYSDGNTLYATAINKKKVWKVNMEGLQTGIWYFLEISFHKDYGLSMYLNQRIRKTQTQYSFQSTPKSKHGDMYIGRGNADMQSNNYPNAYIDEMDIYFADRDTLLYLDFIQRGQPHFDFFSFDQMIGNRITHPSITIEAYGQPKLVPGKIGNAIQLDGNTEYVDLNEHPQKCLGDLDHCHHGFLMSGWVRLDHLKNNMAFLSTALNGISLEYVGGYLVFSVATSAKRWTVKVDPRSLHPGEWQYLEVSWHPQHGLKIYVNEQLINSDLSEGTSAVKSQNFNYQHSEDRFYLGKGKDTSSNMLFGAVTFDNIRYWYGDLDYLLAHGYIQRGRPINYIIDMDKINGTRLLDDSLYITVYGNPKLIPGRVGYAVNLNQSNQYINLGSHLNSCLGNLEKCTFGILLSSWINFGPYRNNMYYYSTGKGGISMYQREGYLCVDFLSGSKKWKIQIPNLKQDTWHFVELSWHRDSGLNMYVNNKLVGHSEAISYKEDNPPQGKEFRIGRPNLGESKGSPSAPNFAIDELEIWYATREDLLASNYIVRVNGASLTEGYIGNGVLLNGIDQHVHIQPDGKDCIYDLEKCPNGLTTSVWLNPKDLKGTKYFLSSPAYSLYSKNGELHAEFFNGTRSWSVSTPDFKTNKWQHVVLSWDPHRGLSMYVDKKKVSMASTSAAYTPRDDPAAGGIYIGTDFNTRERYHANITVDELKYYRTSVNGITRGYGPFLTAEVPEKFYRFDRLLIPGTSFYGHPELTLGSYGKVLKLNGVNQYANLGLNITCGGALENCVDGFVARVTVKPEKLQDNMYILDSYPLSLYYLEGRLYGKLRTATNTWEVSTDKFVAGKWQNIELDWYPEIGLRMFINREEAGHDLEPKKHRWHSTESDTTLGRSLSGSTDDRFLNGMVERIELWRRRRSNQLPTITVPTDIPTADTWLILSGNNSYFFNLSDLNPDNLVSSSNETFKFVFKNDPSQKEGLLWYATNPSRTAFIILKEGNIYFISEDSNGHREKIAMKKPSNIRFDDSTEHEVELRRVGSQIYWTVDGIYRKQFRVPRNMVFLDHRDHVYVGGTSDNTAWTQGEVNKNFKGIIHNAEYITVQSRLGLTRKSTSTGVNPPVTSRPVTVPPKPDTFSPITFTTSESYLRTHSWDIRSRGGEIKFKFLTNDPHGLLLFNGDRKYFIAVELFDGDLYLVYNFGSRTNRVKFSDEVVIDGQPHDVRIKIDPLHTFLDLQIDSFRKRVDLSKNDNFDNVFPGDLHVGWVGPSIARRLPWALFSSKGFRGCLLEFEVNQRRDTLQTDSGSNYGITEECQAIRHQCDVNTCKNGMCRDYWNRYICDCSNTPYTGPNCDEEAPIAVIDGQRYAYYVYEETQASHVDDISLRFQTPLKNATLFHTTAKDSTDTLDVSLVNGEIVLIITANGITKRLKTGHHLNDQKWHTLNIRRRANQLSMWVDDGAAVTKTIKSKNFNFKVNKVDIATRPKDLSGKPNYKFIGYMQNFHYNNLDIFKKLKSDPKQVLIFIYGETSPALVYRAVTFPTQESYVEMPTLEAPTTLKLDLMLKTKESSGVLLYNGGSNNEFIALELQDGYLAMVYNMGSLPRSIYFQTPYKLNDDKWHYVSIHRITPQRWNMMVDNSKIVSTQDKLETLDLDGPLYIGGAPKSVLMKGAVTNLRSTHGFQGCIASINLNEDSADIYGPTAKRVDVLEGCQNMSTLCQPTTCANGGICIQKKNGFVCDCSETTYMGTRCTEQTIGYYFGKKHLDGMIIYTYPVDQRLDSAEETISFGFMTNDQDGTITRVTSSVNRDFIEIKLVDGRLEATYNTGPQVHILTSVKNYSDGAYHTVKFNRNLANSSLIVDGQPALTSSHEGQIVSYFDKLTTVGIGARERTSTNDFINPFHGIIAGYYINNVRPFDNTGVGNNLGTVSGDAEIAIRPFTLGKSIEPEKPTFPEVSTAGPVTEAPVPVTTTSDGGGIIIPPSGGDGDSSGIITGILVESDDDGGFGVAVDVPHYAPIRAGPSILGGTSGSEAGIAAAAFASGATGGAGGPGSAGGAAGAAAGSRAGAAAGTFLALLTLGAGLTWAFVQCKPGMCSPFGGGGGGGGGGGSPSISSPGITAPLIQQSAGGGGDGAGSGQAKVQVVNGSATGAAAGGGSSSGFTFINSGSSYSGANAGQAGDSATLRVTGTFSNKGTAIGTPRQGRSVTAQSSGYSSQQNTLNMHSASAGSGFTYMDGSSAVASGYGGGVTNYDRQVGNYNYESASYMGSGGGGGGGGGGGAVSQQQFDNTMYSSLGVDGKSNIQQDIFSHNTLDAAGYSSSTNTLASAYNYQMKSYSSRHESSSSYNYNTSTMGGSPPAIPGQVVIADGVRVDCCLMTSDGRSVVTGSSTGAPQVWDMQSGELLRAMQGNVAGASNLHLAYNGQLLVGSVNMDNLDANEFSMKKGVTNRNLQIWDFDSGRPLVMPGEEYCSALQVMSDGDKVALGRTNKFGNSTSIIVWDLLGNQPIKEMRYEASVGNNDYISFLNLSQNNRYAVAGFHNSMDGNAEFVVFDMTLTSYNVVEPSILKMNANPECTAILKNEAVTGLKNGDLVVWNLRNGQPLRQMLSASGNHAHNAAVTAVALSEDSSTLVSASADCTIKVWDMSNESLVNTLVGHTGEVSCVAISPDNEIIASGSQDGSIRLWRTKTGSQFCSFNTNMDVFFVTMSRDKGTIVALGDKTGARKLIMLQVVRSKVRRQVPA